jgi:hypothetical protein
MKVFITSDPSPKDGVCEYSVKFDVTCNVEEGYVMAGINKTKQKEKQQLISKKQFHNILDKASQPIKKSEKEKS